MVSVPELSGSVRSESIFLLAEDRVDSDLILNSTTVEDGPLAPGLREGMGGLLSSSSSSIHIAVSADFPASFASLTVAIFVWVLGSG